MINFHETVFQTIKDKIDKMRFVAKNDTKAFRSILNLIILNDVKEWAIYNNECKAKIDYLSKRIDEYILQHSEFIISRQPITSYTNVNTPQTILDWQRVWDNPEVVYNRETEIPVDSKPSFEIDPSYNPKFQYFDHLVNGLPPYDLNLLTNEEKMDLYIDRSTGLVWYLDEVGNWQLVRQPEQEISWDDVQDKPTVYQGVTTEINNDVLNTELTIEPEYGEIELTNDNDVEDML